MSEDPLPPVDVPAPHPATSVAPGSGLPSAQAAGLASLFSLPGGAVFYFLDRKDAFVRYHAVQAIFLGLVLGLVTTLTEVGDAIFSHIWFIGVVIRWVIHIVANVFVLVWAVAWIVTTFFAFKGRQWPLPYIGPIVKRISARPDL